MAIAERGVFKSPAAFIDLLIVLVVESELASFIFEMKLLST